MNSNIDAMVEQAGVVELNETEMREAQGGYAAAILFLIYVGFMAYGASKM